MFEHILEFVLGEVKPYIVPFFTVFGVISALLIYFAWKNRLALLSFAVSVAGRMRRRKANG